jgi:putative membrane protein
MITSHPSLITVAALLAGASFANGCADSTPPPNAPPAAAVTVSSPNEQRAATAPVAVQTTTTSAPVAPPAAATTALEPNLNDGQIARIASDVDQSEIAAAKIALAQSKSAKVRQFAKHMITAHTAVEQDLQATIRAEGIRPEDSSVAEKLTNDSDALASSLRTETGADFDKNYIASQLKAHQDVLELIDTKLLPSVTDVKLRAGLQATRQKVLDHIALAKETQASLSAP